MVRNCSAPFCKTTSKKGLSFFNFPRKNKEKLATWLKCIDRPNWKPARHNQLCMMHFNKTDFKPGLKRLILKATAIPRMPAVTKNKKLAETRKSRRIKNNLNDSQNKNANPNNTNSIMQSTIIPININNSDIRIWKENSQLQPNTVVAMNNAIAEKSQPKKRALKSKCDINTTQNTSQIIIPPTNLMPYPIVHSNNTVPYSIVQSNNTIPGFSDYAVVIGVWQDISQLQSNTTETMINVEPTLSSVYIDQEVQFESINCEDHINLDVDPSKDHSYAAQSVESKNMSNEIKLLKKDRKAIQRKHKRLKNKMATIKGLLKTLKAKHTPKEQEIDVIEECLAIVNNQMNEC